MQKTKYMRDGTGFFQSQKVKQFDMFGSEPGLNFSEESSRFKSWAGSLATCLIFAITLVVTVQNVIVLNNRDNTLFSSQLKYRHNDATRIFTEKDGFQMAIAIVDVNNVT